MSVILAACTPTWAITPDEVCAQIGDRLASVSRHECRALGLESAGVVSVEDRPILVKTYSPLPEREPLGRVLLISGMHGDEYSSVSIVFKWLNILEQHHSGLFHWRIVPLLNPDGLLRADPQRMNANSVDLNRNFPLADWAEVTNEYWIRRTDRNPRRYPGPTALSEPESRWLVDEIRRFEPDVIVSIHAPYTEAEHNPGNEEAGPRADRLGRLSLQKPGTYPGSLERYISTEIGKPFLTLELPYSDIMPSGEAIQSIWLDLLRWLESSAASESTAIAGPE